MKTLVLWAAAVLVAAYLVLRYRRGAPRRLAGKHSQRFAKMVSILLFAVGCGSAPRDTPQSQGQAPAPQKKAQGDAKPGSIEMAPDIDVGTELSAAWQDLFPHSLAAAELNHWLSLQQNSNWKHFKQETTIALLSERAQDNAQASSLLSSVQAPALFISLAQTKPNDRGGLTLAALQTTLREAEAAGFFDTWLVGYLWRFAQEAKGTGEQRAQLYAELESHLRVAESFTIAAAQSKVLVPRPWMSKAAPPSGWTRGAPSFADPEVFLQLAAKEYQKRDSGTWQSQARIAVALEGGTAIFHRRGEEVALPPRSWYLRRLDVLVTTTPCSLRLPYLGAVQIPKDTVVTSVSLYTLLGAQQQKRARSLVVAAGQGQEEALSRVAELMPLLGPELERALDEAPEQPGAAALRSLLLDASW